MFFHQKSQYVFFSHTQTGEPNGSLQMLIASKIYLKQSNPESIWSTTCRDLNFCSEKNLDAVQISEHGVNLNGLLYADNYQRVQCPGMSRSST